MNKKEKILGALMGAAAGDAMGAATELFSTRQIYQHFGGPVHDFMTPPPGTLAEGRRAGQVTDAFSIPWILCRHLLAAQGQVSKKLGEDVLREWGKSEWFQPFAGMTTRKVVKRLFEDDRQEMWSYSGHLGNKLFKSHYYALSSNGAAVKAWPIGLLHPADEESAIGDTLEATLASHDDVLSVSGACAVAAAASRAMDKDSSVYDIIQSAFYGAEQGEKLARERRDICTYPGPSTSARLEIAVELAVRHGENAMEPIRDLVGSGPAIAETVPAALGLLIAHKGQVLPALYDAVNIGDETAAIASLVGAIGGASAGSSVFPENYLTTIQRENSFDLEKMAEEFAAITA